MRRALLAATAVALAFGSAPALADPAPTPPASVAAESAPVAAPAPSRPRPALDTDEGGIWDLADRAEREAKTSADLNRDPALNTYLRSVTCRVAGPQCGDIRLYVMDRPFFNASMAPNGYTEIWSGLLLRLEDEAELAFVIAHEITHYSENHSLEALRELRNRSNTAMALSAAISVIGAAAAVNSPNNARSIMDATQGIVNAAYLGTIFSLFAFSRENETEADLKGHDRAAAAGYDPAAGGRIWRTLIAESAASDDPRRRDRGPLNSLFATHPVDVERASALETKAKTASGAGESGRDRYRAAIRPFLAQWLRDDLRRRDFGTTLHLIGRLKANGEDLGVLTYFEGEAYRTRRKDGDAAKALDAYKAAVTHADAPSVAWRELATAHLRAGDREAARAGFTTYLAKAPNAPDRGLVEMDLQALGGPVQP